MVSLASSKTTKSTGNKATADEQMDATGRCLRYQALYVCLLCILDLSLRRTAPMLSSSDANLIS